MGTKKPANMSILTGTWGNNRTILFSSHKYIFEVVGQLQKLHLKNDAYRWENLCEECSQDLPMFSLRKARLRWEMGGLQVLKMQKEEAHQLSPLPCRLRTTKMGLN